MFDLVTLNLKFDLLLKKNFNIGHNLLTRSDRAFILHMFIACDKTSWYRNIVTLTLKFELLLKTLIFAIIFVPEVIELSYCTCVLLVTKPFTWYCNFLPCELDLGVLTTFEYFFYFGCFLEGCRPASVVVFWKLLFVRTLSQFDDGEWWCPWLFVNDIKQRKHCH